MKFPWQHWLIFALCLAVLLSVMGWMTATTLRLDRAQRETAHQAEREERARLALWRLDSTLTALIVEESARPSSAYRAFYETESAFDKNSNRPLKQGEVVVPSPLLSFTSPNTLLHFQLESGGTLISPQVPAGFQQILASNAQNAGTQRMAAQARLAALQDLLNRPAAGNRLNRDVLMRESDAPNAILARRNEQPTLAPPQRSNIGQQQIRNDIELQSRANMYQQAAHQAVINANQTPAPVRQSPSLESAAAAVVFKALWLGDELLLARRFTQPGGAVVQGVWLNWHNLRESLLTSIRDLFPRAELRRAAPPGEPSSARCLATLPVELITGPEPHLPEKGWSPLELSLAVAWGGVLMAASAAGFFLHGTLSLSERRADFVSAVTHELRTPLTTFKMYSEMLAEDMITDPAKRKGYLATLCSEASRLTHLVENVLAYARLERGSARHRVENVTLCELIERVQPRLLQRADQAGMALVSATRPAAALTRVLVDVSAVEQILFNLVDNACKFASPSATENVIHLEALPPEDSGRFAVLRVRDHGPGISPEAARRLFRPFCKSAAQAARSAPGVGLGLALCRRLSRSLGGELRWDASISDGACFVLTLPLTS